MRGWIWSWLICFGLCLATPAAAQTPLGFDVDETETGGGCWHDFSNTVAPSRLELGGAQPSGFGVDDARLNPQAADDCSNGGGGPEDAYDAFFGLAVDGQLFANPDGDVEVSSNAAGTSVQSDTDTLSDVDVDVQFFLSSSEPCARSVATFSNPTGSSIDATVRFGGDVGSDTSTLIDVTSSGDTEFDTADRWTVSSARQPSTDVVNLFVWHGPGDPAAPPSSVADFADRPDKWNADYDISVPAGGESCLMWFACITEIPTEAEELALAHFDDNADLAEAGLLAGLSDEDLACVANWDFEAPEGPALPSAGPAALTLLSLGLALLTGRRIRAAQAR